MLALVSPQPKKNEHTGPTCLAAVMSTDGKISAGRVRKHTKSQGDTAWAAEGGRVGRSTMKQQAGKMGKRGILARKPGVSSSEMSVESKLEELSSSLCVRSEVRG